jgi:hypothetical protein
MSALIGVRFPTEPEEIDTIEPMDDQAYYVRLKPRGLGRIGWAYARDLADVLWPRKEADDVQHP